MSAKETGGDGGGELLARYTGHAPREHGGGQKLDDDGDNHRGDVATASEVRLADAVLTEGQEHVREEEHHTTHDDRRAPLLAGDGGQPILGDKVDDSVLERLLKGFFANECMSLTAS